MRARAAGGTIVLAKALRESPTQRMREIFGAARFVQDDPLLYPVTGRSLAGLELRRRTVAPSWRPCVMNDRRPHSSGNGSCPISLIPIAADCLTTSNA